MATENFELEELYRNLSEEFGEYTTGPKLDVILNILIENNIEYEFYSHYFEKEKLKTKDINEAIINSLKSMTVYEVEETIKEQYPEKNKTFIIEQTNKIKEAFKELSEENNRANQFMFLEDNVEAFNSIAKNAILFKKEEIFEGLDNQPKRNRKNKL